MAQEISIKNYKGFTVGELRVALACFPDDVMIHKPRLYATGDIPQEIKEIRSVLDFEGYVDHVEIR